MYLLTRLVITTIQPVSTGVLCNPYFPIISIPHLSRLDSYIILASALDSFTDPARSVRWIGSGPVLRRSPSTEATDPWRHSFACVARPASKRIACIPLRSSISPH